MLVVLFLYLLNLQHKKFSERNYFLGSENEEKNEGVKIEKLHRNGEAIEINVEC